jgi:DNA gyrase/topoisomerase IV subunit B
MQYNIRTTETIFSFVNNIKTVEGGTHLSASARRSPATINAYLA